MDGKGLNPNYTGDFYLSIAAFPQNLQQLKAFRPDLLCSLVHTVLWNFKLLTIIHVTGKTKESMTNIRYKELISEHLFTIVTTALLHHNIQTCSTDGQCYNNAVTFYIELEFNSNLQVKTAALFHVFTKLALKSGKTR